MPWNIAQAKQHFSEMVKKAAEEPQLIYNRNQPVAAVIDAAEFARFEEWKKAQKKPRTLTEDLAELRQLLREEGFEEGLKIPPRADRPNAFVQMFRCWRRNTVSYLVDTNIIGELSRPAPDVRVVRWSEAVERYCLSAVTVEEV